MVVPGEEELQNVEVGLRVYADSVPELAAMVFGSKLGIKPQIGSAEDFASPAAPDPAAMSTAPGAVGAGAPAGETAAADHARLLQILEAGIRQKIEAEIREKLKSEIASGSGRDELIREVRDAMEEEEQNRRLAVRMTLIAEGDRLLHQTVLSWQQAKQSADGGPPWNETKQCLLQLLDVTVQLTHS